ncbi:LAFE_0G15170g1_1 [Lachancea fermentati]|uniref:LAFE_0G15170g1_1 n=1 Tax=Lachancea fermentati TaxID=4955 RepID=A0A1G4MIC3_LACFM|nr:LAFE_0G15170g1_1 [Lachancea fermentati]
MNFSGGNNQEPLGSINSNFRDMTLSGSSTPLTGESMAPLSRPTSLLDTLGIQRASSPFVAPNQNTISSLNQPPNFGTQHSSLTSGWAQPAANGGHMLPQLPQLVPSVMPEMPQSFGNPMAAPISGAAEFGSRGINAAGATPPVMLLPTVESQWKYIDNQGQVQGPFPSSSMKAWYQAGYLQVSLQVYRVSTSPEPFGFNDTFTALGEIINKVGDLSDPFGKLDILLSQDQSCLPGSTPFPLMSESEVPRSQIDSPDYTHAQILQLRDSGGGFYHEIVSQIPVDKFVEKVDKIDRATHVEEIKQRQLKEMETQRRIEFAERQRQELAFQEIEKKRKEEQLEQLRLEEELALRHQAEQKALKQREKELEKVAAGSENGSSNQVQEEPYGRRLHEISESDKRIEVEAVTKETELVTSVSPAIKPAKPAPWANKASHVVPGPSLAEIQQREAAESARRKKELEIKSREQAAKLKQQALEESKPTVSIESIAPWASKKSGTVADSEARSVVKSIEQVQKEQLEQKKFIAEQKRLWEEAQRSAKLKKEDRTNTVTESKEWTTVVKKQPAVKAQSSKVINQPSSYISPDKLRSVSANKPNQIGSSTSIPTLKGKVVAPAATNYTGNASTSARQEFLKWCRSQMKLSPGVDANGVLEVLLSLPAGPEAREIIADTIYSNSSIMDGRRFATDFIKRRVECERKLNDPLTWSEALLMPEGNSDDWEFQVVTKKKNRKR